MIQTPGGRPWLHQAFVALVFVLGLAALVDAIRTMQVEPPGLQLIALSLVTIASSRYSVKVPALSATLSISETFLFIVVLYFGAAPAVVTVAIDGLVISLLRRRRALRLVAFNMAEPVLSMWVAAQIYYAISGVAPLSEASATMVEVGLPALVLSGVYFLMNTGLNASAMATETGASPYTLWRKFFLGISLNYFGGASVAVLFALNTRSHGIVQSVVAIAPLVLVSYFTIKSSMDRLEDENRHLGEVNQLYLKVVETLAMAVDAKDQVTHGHVRRVQTYTLHLARVLGVSDPQELRAIEAASLLHDMGKLAIPEHILNKPGKLTAEEYERMKLHAPLGADMLSAVGFPYPVVPIVRHHHENWDGSGYPDGLKAEAIPIGARVLSVIDCYDALRSHRPYRRALSPEQSLGLIRERRGTMYDPAVVDAFEAIQSTIEAAKVDEPLPDVLERFAQAAREMRRPDAGVPPVPLEVRVAATDTVLRLYAQLSNLGAGATTAECCEVASRQLLRMAPAGLVVFYERLEANDEVRAVYASGFGETLVQDVSMPLGHGVSGWVAANGRSVINADTALDLGDRLSHIEPQFRSVLSVPLTTAQGHVGAVALYSSQPGAFREEQRQAIELVSRPMAEAIARALAADTLAGGRRGRSDAREDSSGRTLHALIETGMGLTAGAGRTLGVLCVKNDGSPEVMAHAAAAVSQATRIADLIFRPSDQTIVVLMRDCDTGAGQLIADRVAAAMPPEVVPPPSPESPLRIAFACSPVDGDTVRQLIEAAERRLGARIIAPDVGASAAEAPSQVLVGGGVPWRS